MGRHVRGWLKRDSRREEAEEWRLKVGWSGVDRDCDPVAAAGGIDALDGNGHFDSLRQCRGE